MSTVAGIGTITTERDLLILRTLVIARVLDSEQIRNVGRFSSLRRTNRRLLKLVRAGLLKRWFVGTKSGGQKALYGLSPRGANLIGETTQGLIPWKQNALITVSQFLGHQQAVNDVFLRVRVGTLPQGFSCAQWTRPRLPLSSSVPLIPDGYFEIAEEGVVHPLFLEVDLGTESSRTWKRKTELYLQFATSREAESLQPKRLRVIVLFPSVRRLQSIRQVIAKRTQKLFWLSTMDEVRSQGLWAPIWLRPVGQERQRLL